MMLRAIGYAFILLFAGVATSHAQAPQTKAPQAKGPQAQASQAPSPEFASFLIDPQYIAYIAKGVAQNEPEPLRAECATVKPVVRASLAILQPPKFAKGVKTPLSGQWIDRVKVDRCGKPGVRSFMITAPGNNQMHLVALLPGDTNASPALQNDATGPAKTAASAKLGCTAGPMHIVDTKSVAKPAKGPWRETWTFSGCGKNLTLPIEFAPDSGGGATFSIKAGS
jgi:hypothetical protein